MKVSNKKHEYFEIDITFNEEEIRAIIGAIEQCQYYQNRPLTDIGGIREQVYLQLTKIINPTLN